MQIILASSSKYRQQLLKNIGIEAICFAPNIDESIHPAETPEHLAERLAVEKAKAIATKHSGLVIGSDQVARNNDSILGKPMNAERAFKQLQQCSGQRVDFITGLCLINTKSGNIQSCTERFSVVFRHLSDDEIKRYIDIEKPFDCAGSFKVEGLGISLFEKLEGDDPNSLIGLPLIKLCQFLRNEGLDFP